MPRIRSIKPETWQDKKLAERLSRDARLLYISLWNLADEHARLQGDPRFIKGQVFPYDDDLGLADIERMLAELASAGRIVRYAHEDDPFIFLPKLAKHQRLEPSKVPSKLPAPPDTSTALVRTDESARDADKPGTIVALHGACSREPVTGSMEHVAPAEPTRAGRKPDPVWDALMDACDVDTARITATSRGAYNRATADLKAVEATPAEIARRAGVFSDRWPEASLTPTALARRWAECDRSPPRTTSSGRKVQAGLGVAEQFRAEGR